MRRLFVALAGLVVIGGVFYANHQRRLAGAIQLTADSVLALNRAGHWNEAERVGAQALQRTSPSEATDARCQVTEGVAYAQSRQQKHADASATLRLYESACTGVPSLRGFTREAVRLRAEIDSAVGLTRG